MNTRKKYKYECMLKECPFKETTNIQYCVYYTEDGIEILCSYCIKRENND